MFLCASMRYAHRKPTSSAFWLFRRPAGTCWLGAVGDGRSVLRGAYPGGLWRGMSPLSPEHRCDSCTADISVSDSYTVILVVSMAFSIIPIYPPYI